MCLCLNIFCLPLRHVTDCGKKLLRELSRFVSSRIPVATRAAVNHGDCVSNRALMDAEVDSKDCPVWVCVFTVKLRHEHLPGKINYTVYSSIGQRPLMIARDCQNTWVMTRGNDGRFPFRTKVMCKRRGRIAHKQRRK